MIKATYLITSRMLSDCNVISNAINKRITLISRTFSTMSKFYRIPEIYTLEYRKLNIEEKKRDK